MISTPHSAPSSQREHSNAVPPLLGLGVAAETKEVFLLQNPLTT
jgi:hypothetical protein